MRWDAKVDVNQKEIIAAARKMGGSVESLHRLGCSIPDLLIGVNGLNLLWEAKTPGGRGLSVGQREWHTAWRGQVQVIESVDQAIEAINRVRNF